MDQQKPSLVTPRQTSPEQVNEPQSLTISERGVKTGADFANLMSALMTDIIAGRVTPQVGNAACNAGGKLLKVVEMQYQYGKQNGSQGDRTLLLAPGDAA